MSRTFEDKPAVRQQTPLLTGIMGPSGSGKTFSALRLATGIQRVTGGDIFGIDTEARRMLHYADRFRFRHLEFKAPFGSLDYLAAAEHCVVKGGKIVIVDSTSHEHEGPGGVLETHEQEVERISKAWGCPPGKAQIAAWGKPKSERRRFINTILQLPCSFIFCFRAKEKLKIVKGKDPEQLGWMPIAGDELVYEMTLNCLLLPNSRGYPCWQSEYPGERLMMKLPDQFVHLFQDPNGTQLSEDLGEQLARWAAGTPAGPSVQDMLDSYADCRDRTTFDRLEGQRRAVWDRAKAAEKTQLKAASDAASKRLSELPPEKQQSLIPGVDDDSLTGLSAIRN